MDEIDEANIVPKVKSEFGNIKKEKEQYIERLLNEEKNLTSVYIEAKMASEKANTGNKTFYVHPDGTFEKR